MTPLDAFGHVVLLGPLTASPDGGTAVVVARRADLDADDYTSQLWAVDLPGGPPRPLTHGWRDTAPAYSPDGRWLAFLRTEQLPKGGEPGRPQVWVMPTRGGDARRLTGHHMGADSPVWSPDSTTVAYTVREADPGRYGTVEGRVPDQEPPRRITRMFYRTDGLGYTNDRPRHLWSCALDGEPVRLTDGDLDHGDARWSPDGRTLVFTCAGHATRGDDLRIDVWACAADGTGRRALTGGGVSASQPWFTPDGAAVVFTSGDLGEDGLRGAVRNVGLWSVPVAGGAATRLSDEETHTLTGAIEATADGVLALAEHRGAVRLLRFGYPGGPPDVLADGDRQVLAAAAAGTGVVFVAADAASHGELVFRAADGTESTLTDFGSGYRAATTIYAPHEFEAPTPDGHPVHGWLVRPDGDGPHPLLLMIHGGPYTQYGWQLFDEAQVLASAGYAVLLTNPRGSSGYGQSHGRAVIGDVGAVSTRDLMAALEHTLATNADLDPARVGVLGGSHGGFMTTWLAAHEGHRFKAAVSERAVNAIDSFEGSSDIGWFFADNLYGTDPEARRRQSPLTYADRISVPLLIIHSEQDHRCPLEQAQRLYVALKRRDAPVEMLVFPGEGHELSRSGQPSHRVARFEAILEWFGRHM